MKGTVLLETNRLILRRFNLDDACAMYQNWASDEDTCRYLTWKVHQKLDVTRAYLESVIENYADPYYFNWVVERKVDGVLIGNISVVKASINDLVCEIGYCYGSKYWNQGYGTESLKCILAFLLKEVGFELVEASYVSINPASGKVMLKAGMKYDATLRARRIDDVTKHRVDLVKYSLMKDEL